jgi:macrophage erythroblast attacher
VDIKLVAELTKIERALVEKHSVAEALAWCGENRGTLKKTKVRRLNFEQAYSI